LKLVEILKGNKGLLKDSDAISVEEQLLIFMMLVTKGMPNFDLTERFQHSGETISRYVNGVLAALYRLVPDYIVQPNPDHIPEKIRHDPRFYPYFKDAIGVNFPKL
jgi:hypothetical protein